MIGTAIPLVVATGGLGVEERFIVHGGKGIMRGRVGFAEELAQDSDLVVGEVLEVVGVVSLGARPLPGIKVIG
jgi:hypothetical protein